VRQLHCPQESQCQNRHIITSGFPEREAPWQRFENVKDAERRAKELTLRDERYIIEPIIGKCEASGPVIPRNAALTCSPSARPDETVQRLFRVSQRPGR